MSLLTAAQRLRYWQVSVDSAWEQRKLDATLCEILAVGAAEYH
jgi:hypothetical protein